MLRLKFQVRLLLKRGLKLWLHPAVLLSPEPSGVAETEQRGIVAAAHLVVEAEIQPVFPIERNVLACTEIVAAVFRVGNNLVILHAQQRITRRGEKRQQALRRGIKARHGNDVSRKGRAGERIVNRNRMAADRSE